MVEKGRASSLPNSGIRALIFAVSMIEIRVLSQLGFTVVVSSRSGFLGFTGGLLSVYCFY